MEAMAKDLDQMFANQVVGKLDILYEKVCSRRGLLQEAEAIWNGSVRRGAGRNTNDFMLLHRLNQLLPEADRLKEAISFGLTGVFIPWTEEAWVKVCFASTSPAPGILGDL